MTSAFRVLLLAVCWCCSLVQAAELAVAIGVQDTAQAGQPGRALPPNTPGFQLVALSDDLAREICRRINARCTLHYVAFGEILAGVEDRRFDIAFGNLLRSPEREQRVDFSDAIWHSSSRLVATPATSKSFATRLGRTVTLDNLRDARVAAVDGSRQHAFITSDAGDRLTAIATPASADAIGALRDDTADFALLPVISAYALLNHDGAQKLEFVGPAVADRGLGGSVHLALSKQNDTLRHSVNRAIAAIRADGSFQRITRRYFPHGLD